MPNPTQLEPCTQAAIDEGCTCWMPTAGPTDIDPPEPRRDRACPLHGDMRHVDPDLARDEQQDREWMDK